VHPLYLVHHLSLLIENIYQYIRGRVHKMYLVSFLFLAHPRHPRPKCPKIQWFWRRILPGSPHTHPKCLGFGIQLIFHPFYLDNFFRPVLPKRGFTVDVERWGGLSVTNSHTSTPFRKESF